MLAGHALLQHIRRSRSRVCARREPKTCSKRICSAICNHAASVESIVTYGASLLRVEKGFQRNAGTSSTDTATKLGNVVHRNRLYSSVLFQRSGPTKLRVWSGDGNFLLLLGRLRYLLAHWMSFGNLSASFAHMEARGNSDCHTARGS